MTPTNPHPIAERLLEIASTISEEAKQSLLDAEYDERQQVFVPPFCRGTSRELAHQLLIADMGGIWWKLTDYGVAVRDVLRAQATDTPTEGDK